MKGDADMIAGAADIDSCRSESWLKQTQLLRGLPERLIRHVASHMTERQLCDKEILFLQHDPCHFIGIVVDGMIYHVLFNPDGRELIIERSAPGQVIGITALIGQELRCETACASGVTRILILSRAHFQLLLKERAFLERLLDIFKTQVEAHISFIETMCLYPLEVRLARHLLDNLQASGTATPHVRLPAYQGLLASMINASRPKLNASLQAWKRQGLAHIRQDCLLIDDLSQIRCKACLRTLSPR
ncbi:MAG: Crp/Fnr family transcriptional regulator [Azoarcus sp.]|nr:Crp/Fnr family transcriptional regulator [Azoarcus sp.]